MRFGDQDVGQGAITTRQLDARLGKKVRPTAERQRLLGSSQPGGLDVQRQDYGGTGTRLRIVEMRLPGVTSTAVRSLSGTRRPLTLK